MEYRLPTWGITLLAAVGFVSASVGFVVFLFSFYTPALPSDVPHVPLPLVEVLLLGFFFVVNLVTVFLSFGLLFRWNTARIMTAILAPAPFVGVVLEFVHSSLVNKVITQDLTASQQASAIVQLAPLGRLAVALEFTGLSFPGVAPVLGISLYGTAPYGMSLLLVVLGLLNLGVPFYLVNRHVKDAFRRRGDRSSMQKPSPLPCGLVMIYWATIFFSHRSYVSSFSSSPSSLRTPQVTVFSNSIT